MVPGLAVVEAIIVALIGHFGDQPHRRLKRLEALQAGFAWSGADSMTDDSMMDEAEE